MRLQVSLQRFPGLRPKPEAPSGQQDRIVAGPRCSAPAIGSGDGSACRPGRRGTARALSSPDGRDPGDRKGDVGAVGGRRGRAIAWPRSGSPGPAQPRDRLRAIRAPARAPCQPADVGSVCTGWRALLARALVSPAIGEDRDLAVGCCSSCAVIAAGAGGVTGRMRVDPALALRQRCGGDGVC